MKKPLILALAAVVAQPALASEPVTSPVGAEVSIPFAAHGGIRDWERESDRSILLRDRGNRWYRATFVGTCPRVGYGGGLVFETDAAGTFDRFSSIRSEYGICQVGSLVRAAAPASKGGH